MPLSREDKVVSVLTMVFLVSQMGKVILTIRNYPLSFIKGGVYIQKMNEARLMRNLMLQADPYIRSFKGI